MKRRPSGEDQPSMSKARDLKRSSTNVVVEKSMQMKDKDESRQPQSPPFLSTGNN